MRVKKFVAPTMPEAMQKIRKELGNDAVILNSKVVQQGGFLGLFRKKNIEVIAAIDPQPTKPKNEQVKVDLTKNAISSTLEKTATKPQVNQDVLNEIRELKQMMKTNAKGNEPIFPKPIQNIYEYLMEQEVHEHYANEISNQLTEKYFGNSQNVSSQQLLNWTKEIIKTKLEAISFGGVSYKKRMLHLVGPTGVGKTTTIAKIAAACVLRDHKRVAFITTDTYRIAAIDQLKTYAKILDIPIEIAYNLEDYKKAREKYKDYDLILVDTAGRNFRDKKYVDELKNIVDFDKEMETFLVLSLTSKVKDMEAIYKQFSEVPINRLIFTKADETAQYGAILNLLFEQKIGVAYLTNGQNVPDDITEASAHSIISTIVGEYHE